jgi:putative peptide zinc metalloprotease protein
LTDNCARLRSDLEIRAETTDPRSAVIVKDPLTRGFYRFTWVQATVLRGLDGRHAAGEIAAEASRQCQVQVATDQVEDFITKLQSLALLDDALSWSRIEKLTRRKHRFVDSLLSIKIHAFNPDRLLTRLDKKLGGFLFGPACHALAVTSIAAGIILTIVNWEQLFFSWPQIFSLYSIPLILVVAFAVMTIHEFAHGLTLKHFGGRVEEMGLLFLYFIPAFYCNVNDAWLLSKRRRIAVSFAGGYAQLVVWAWAAILWRLLAPETLGSRICLIAIAFSGILTLFNFNPLIRLDGYYMLSDYLETPNLRPKAFRYLKRKVSGWLIGVGSRGAAFTGREKRIFVIYGLSSFVFSAALILIVLGRLESWMVAEYRTWGIVLFSMVCLMIFPMAGKENATAAGRLAAGVGIRIKKAPYLLIMLAVLLAAAFLPWELKITGDFAILPNAQVAINPEVEGTLKAIYVDESDQVKKGDVLAEIQNLDLSNTYEDTRGELATARASLSLLQAGNRPEEIERARRVIETRKTDLDNAGRVQEERRMLEDTIAKKDAELQNARATFERSKTLISQGLIPKNEFDRDQTAYDVKLKELAEARGSLKMLEERIDRERQIRAKELQQAQSDLKILLAGSRKESIQAVEAQVAKLEEKLIILGQQLEQLKIRSTIDGLIATPYLKNKIGKYVEKGSPFCEIVDVRTVRVDMPIPEKEIEDVSPGYPIVLRVNAFPKLSFIAEVKTISPVAVEGSRQRTVVVKGELGNSDGSLKAGMTGVGKILCGKRMIGELVTRRFVRWLRTEFWEYLP